ncbi:MAG: RNA polymerase sigma factor [Bacilli bacterium]|jgi:RNA polymerase sigma-70 factor (ECF subfamily)|nr:RNA polymerase sigma factor [Bacilli bacterium]
MNERVDREEMISIIKELKKGNMNFFDDFYDLTKKQVYYAIVMILKDKSLSEDIMQDTYIRFLEKINYYNERTNVVAFIVTIARNLAINAYNKRKREVIYDIYDHDDMFQAEEKKETPLLNLVMETLEGEEREVFLLHVIDELKHREIAKVMNKPLGTITWMYNNAVKKMRGKVGENNG